MTDSLIYRLWQTNLADNTDHLADKLSEKPAEKPKLLYLVHVKPWDSEHYEPWVEDSFTPEQNLEMTQIIQGCMTEKVDFGRAMMPTGIPLKWEPVKCVLTKQFWVEPTTKWLSPDMVYYYMDDYNRPVRLSREKIQQFADQGILKTCKQAKVRTLGLEIPNFETTGFRLKVVKPDYWTIEPEFVTDDLGYSEWFNREWDSVLFFKGQSPKILYVTNLLKFKLVKSRG